MPKGVYERTPEMKTGKYKRTPEMNAAMSRSTKGILRSPECRAAMSSARLGVPISPHTPEHRAALSEAGKNSESMQIEHDRQRGGNDMVWHHIIYDHDDLSKNRILMTRANHTMGHNVLRKLGIKIPHINVKEE